MKERPFMNHCTELEHLLLHYANSIFDFHPEADVYLEKLPISAEAEDGIAIFEVCQTLDEETEEVLGKITLFDDFSILIHQYD